MLLRLNKLILRDGVFYCLIILLAAMRVITSKVKACPRYFDCESYLAMVNSIQFDPTIAGHHAMRILPSLLARLVHEGGFNLTTSFQIVSGATYILLGVLVYEILRREKQTPWVAFAFTLICLAPHYAMNIPLQLVYQASDMMVYPITLLILYASLKRNVTAIFILGILGIFVRQNLFILTELSLIFCYTKNKNLKTILYGLLLGIAYFSSQIYYEATGVFGALLNPPKGYFSYSNLKQVILGSRVLELFISLIPFLFFSWRALIQFFKENWHLTLYGLIVVGQPLLAYHLTGNNTQRLALQGIWILFFACALTWPKSQSKSITFALVLYALGVYFIWSVPQRLLFLMGLVPFSFIPQRL